MQINPRAHRGRNPFVNQVSFFIVNLTQHTATPEQMSQSLRKSGQFLLVGLREIEDTAIASQSLRKSGQFLYTTMPADRIPVAVVAIPS